VEHERGKANDEDQSKATDVVLGPFIGEGAAEIGEGATAEVSAVG
jgi:hypothetical protein